jgi:hypothetical protein
MKNPSLKIGLASIVLLSAVFIVVLTTSWNNANTTNKVYLDKSVSICPPLILSSPTSVVYTEGNGGCNTACRDCCSNSFSLSGAPCMPVKYHFKNVNTNWTCTYQTSANPFVLKSSFLKGTAGQTMEVWVEAVGGGANSSTYTFTCSGCP